MSVIHISIMTRCYWGMKETTLIQNATKNNKQTTKRPKIKLYLLG